MQILQVIKRHGYRLEDVANALGITKGSLSATINGSPNVKKLIEISLVIGCSPAEFFDDWYDNEGKEQQRPAAQQPSAQPSQQPAALPFGGTTGSQPSATSGSSDASTPQPSALAHQPSLQQAIICPHCHQALVVNIASYEQK